MKIKRTLATAIGALSILPFSVLAQDVPLSKAIDKAQTAVKEVEAEEQTETEDHSGHDDEVASDIDVKDVEFAFTEAPDDHVLGDDKAAITIIVYASVTCSHCSDWFTDQWPVLKKDLIESGIIRFVLRELPTPPAQMSMVGFMMAECAPENDYFDVVQYQMENQMMMFKQAEKGQAREEYDKVGKLAGLEDRDAIQACLEDRDKLAHIHLNSNRATAAKVQGVPAFFINGDIYKGDQTAEALTKLVLDMNEKGLSQIPTTLP